MVRRFLLLAAVTLLPAGLIAAASVAAAGTSAGAFPARCTGVIQITQLAFSPPITGPGQSTAGLAARNCTHRTQQVTVTWFASFTGSGTGIPAGCPAMDPFPQQENFTRHGKISLTLVYEVPLCPAAQLQLTVQIAQNGSILAEQTASLSIVEPSASFSATPTP